MHRSRQYYETRLARLLRGDRDTFGGWLVLRDNLSTESYSILAARVEFAGPNARQECAAWLEAHQAEYRQSA